MKTKDIAGLLLSLSGLATATTSMAQVRVADAYLGSCEIISSFDASLVVRVRQGAGGFDTITYDLNYLLKDRYMRTVYDPSGAPVSALEYETSRPASKHFEIAEPLGNEQRMAEEVRRWIRGRVVFACGS